MTKHADAVFKQQLALATDGELFDIWAREYDARHDDRVKLVIEVMNKRGLSNCDDPIIL